MSKPIAAGLIGLGFAALGLIVSADQVTESPSKPRNDARVQDAGVEQAEVAVKLAEQNVAIQQLQNGCDVAAAESKCQLAQLNLNKYTAGDMVHEKNVLTAEVEMAADEKTRAQDKLTAAQQSVKQDGGKQDDVEDARRAYVKAKNQHDLARNKLALLVDFESRRRIAELEYQANQCKREVKLVQMKAEAALAAKRRR